MLLFIFPSSCAVRKFITENDGRFPVLIGNNTRAEHTKPWISTYKDPLSPDCTRIPKTHD